MEQARVIPIDERRFAVLADMRDRVTEALAHWNAAKLAAKDKHQAYEAARETFEREFDRLVKTTRGEDLPLFQSMADAVDAAKSDPVVTKLVERLIARGHEVNALIVHGYTEEERNAVATYLDLLDKRDQSINTDAEIDDVEVPAFLVPQPLTALEVADFITRLDACDFATGEGRIRSWTQAELATVRAWLTDTEAIKERLGEAVTVDDLPAAPDLLYTPLPQAEASTAGAEA